VLHIMGRHGFKAIPRRAEGQKDQRRGVEPRDSAGQTSAHPIPLAGLHRKSIRDRYGAEPSARGTRKCSLGRSADPSKSGCTSESQSLARLARKSLFGLVHSRHLRRLFSPLWAFRLLAAGLAGATLALRQKFARLRGANPGAKQAQSDGLRRVGHIVIERCRKQCALPAIQPFDKARFIRYPASRRGILSRESQQTERFHTPWAPSCRLTCSGRTSAFGGRPGYGKSRHAGPTDP
jgi:hypothetical protein